MEGGGEWESEAGVEEAGSEEAGVAAEVAAADVAVDGVDVLLSVQVGADILHEVVVDEPFGHVFHFFAVVAGEAQEVDLKVHAVVVECDESVAVVVIVDISLGMGENESVALHFELKEGVVEVPWLLYEGVFDQQVVAGDGRYGAGGYLRQGVVVDAEFGRVAQANIDAFVLQGLAQGID